MGDVVAHILALSIIDIEGKGGQLHDQDHLGSGVVEGVTSIVLKLANQVAIIDI